MSDIVKDVGLQDLITNLIPGGIPLFLILLHRYLKKHRSRYARAGILSVGISLYVFKNLQLGGWMRDLVGTYLMCSAEVAQSDESYQMILSWMGRQRLASNSRTFQASIGSSFDYYRSALLEVQRDAGAIHSTRAKAEAPVSYVPTYGTYRFWHQNNLYFFTRSGSDRSREGHFTEEISISCFGRNPQRLKLLIEECITEGKKDDTGKTIIYTMRSASYRGDEGWTRGMARVSRPFSSVVLDPEIKTSIIKDLEKGIPYRRGYLLHGPPGTGKTSLSFAIAGHFKLNIYICNLNNPSVTEQILGIMFAALPQQCVILMEDVDAAGLSNKRTPSNHGGGKITLSGLLNVIDGVASQEGRVLIMTTNHIEKLDPALIRPGRIDMKVEFKNAHKPELSQIFLDIYIGIPVDSTVKVAEVFSFKDPEDDEAARLAKAQKTKEETQKEDAKKTFLARLDVLAEQFSDAIPGGKFSPAEIQGYLVRWKDDPESAVKNAAAWLDEVRGAKAAAVAAEKAIREDAAMEKAEYRAEVKMSDKGGSEMAERQIAQDAKMAESKMAESKMAESKKSEAESKTKSKTKDGKATHIERSGSEYGEIPDCTSEETRTTGEEQEDTESNGVALETPESTDEEKGDSHRDAQPWVIQDYSESDSDDSYMGYVFD